MSNAAKCDCCGALVEEDTVVNLGEVHAPDGTSWSDVDICVDCFGRPFGEVMTEACMDFSDHAPQKDDDAPSEPTFQDGVVGTSLGTQQGGEDD